MHTAYWSSLEPRLHQHTHTLIFLDHNIFFYSKIDQPPTLIQNPLAGNITLQQQARSPCTQVWHQYLPVMDTACYNSTIIHPLISYFILLSLPFCPNPHFLPNDLFNSYFFFAMSHAYKPRAFSWSIHTFYSLSFSCISALTFIYGTWTSWDTTDWLQFVFSFGSCTLQRNCKWVQWTTHFYTILNTPLHIPPSFKCLRSVPKLPKLPSLSFIQLVKMSLICWQTFCEHKCEKLE
jgi:hypothetical protein